MLSHDATVHLSCHNVDAFDQGMWQCHMPCSKTSSSQFLTISALSIKAIIMWLRESWGTLEVPLVRGKRAAVPFTPESAHRSHSTVVMSASGDQPMSRRARRETGSHMFVGVISLYPDAVGSCVWKSKRVINHSKSLKVLSFHFSCELLSVYVNCQLSVVRCECFAGTSKSL